MSGVTDLDELLRSMTPERVPGAFVYGVVPHDPADGPPGRAAILASARASVVEDEGLTVVVPKEVADEHGWVYDFVAAWITLRVHSSLAAVGLTAAVAAALTAEGISCNVIAGAFHDHLLVPVDRAVDALAALERLSAR